jgi:NAD-dependent dihydropyrimidine dehydrogenase PreA subunit
MSLVHTITGEASRLRRRSLYIFARYIEMPLLRWGYALLRGRLRPVGYNPLVRAMLRRAVAMPLGYAGDTARPMPLAQVQRLVDELDGPMAVGSCRCRTAHGACDHPLETDIVFRTGVEAWTRAFPDEYRSIGKEEAKEILARCGELGMWPMVFVHCPVHEHGHSRSTRGSDAFSLTGPLPQGRAAYGPANEYVICNCCTCGCVPFILNRDLGQEAYPLLRGAYVARTDTDRCTGHGRCVAACPFGVRTVVDGKAQLVEPCFGCGLCVTACPEGAIEMEVSGGVD